MLKQIAWNTFKNTGDINTMMELMKVEKAMKGTGIGNTPSINENSIIRNNQEINEKNILKNNNEITLK